MSLGMPEIVMLLIVMILVFGPKRIPEIGKSVGEAIQSFRKATKEDDKAAVAQEPIENSGVRVS